MARPTKRVHSKLTLRKKRAVNLRHTRKSAAATKRMVLTGGKGKELIEGGVAPPSNERMAMWSKPTQPEAPKTKKGFLKGLGNLVSRLTKKNKEGAQEIHKEDFENLDLRMFSNTNTNSANWMAGNVVFPIKKTIGWVENGPRVRMLKRNKKTGSEKIVYRTPGEHPYVNEDTGAELRHRGGVEDYIVNTGPELLLNLSPQKEVLDPNLKAGLLEQQEASGRKDPLPPNPNPFPLPPRATIISSASFFDPNEESIIKVDAENQEVMPNNMAGVKPERIVSAPTQNMVVNAIRAERLVTPAYNPPTNAQKQMLAELVRQDQAVAEELKAINARKDAGVGYRGLGGRANMIKRYARHRAAARRVEQQQALKPSGMTITQSSRLGPRGAVKGPTRQAAMTRSTRSTSSMYLPPPVATYV